jgi:hypothetical protein
MTPPLPLRQRPFAYSEVYLHPPIDGPAFDQDGWKRDDLPPEIATLCKNESNCTVFLDDGAWLTTWSQGSYEHAPDERAVFAISRDMGRHWSAPATIITSTPEERRAYGAPFVTPDAGRLYFFYFAGRQDVPFHDPAYDAGQVCFVSSDDLGASWSAPHPIPLPDRDLDIFAGRFHGWINHPPQVMPTGEVILPVSAARTNGLRRRAWMLAPAEVRVIRCDNLLTERDPDRLQFTLLPDGPRGIRVDAAAHRDNPALRRLTDAFDGTALDSGFNFQEMTVVALDDERWLGVGRTFLGAPGCTLSMDRGHSWTPVEPLCDRPGGTPLRHPMTMCPLARMTDGRLVLLYTDNDGSRRGARHVWDGDGRTRNPQYLAVGRACPDGLHFGPPLLIADVDDSGPVNLKTGISMPQFFQRDGRNFVCYNVNKEFILLDEIPMAVLDAITP